MSTLAVVFVTPIRHYAATLLSHQPCHNSSTFRRHCDRVLVTFAMPVRRYAATYCHINYHNFSVCHCNCDGIFVACTTISLQLLGLSSQLRWQPQQLWRGCCTCDGNPVAIATANREIVTVDVTISGCIEMDGCRKCDGNPVAMSTESRGIVTGLVWK